jgi:hypothetical protein
MNQSAFLGLEPIEMKDSQFMTAKEKRKVLKQWRDFLESGLKAEKFTRALYEHLHQHCSFIAHYDQGGFYATYFTTGDGITRFLSQFDKRNAGSNGIPPGVEYGSTWWVNDEYGDINRAMIEIATPYIPGLLQEARKTQRGADIRKAKRLLAKHEIDLNIE